LIVKDCLFNSETSNYPINVTEKPEYRALIDYTKDKNIVLGFKNKELKKWKK
jgi:hypothetical protein